MTHQTELLHHHLTMQLRPLILLFQAAEKLILLLKLKVLPVRRTWT